MKENLKYALVWFLVGAWFIKFLCLDPLADQRLIAEWPDVQATVLSSEVTLDSAGNEYELGIRFEALIAGSKQTYSRFANTGKKGHMDSLATTKYAPGASFPILVNPADRKDYRIPTRAIGPWLTGLFPGVIFLYIGWSVLRGKRAASADEGVGTIGKSTHE